MRHRAQRHEEQTVLRKMRQRVLGACWRQKWEEKNCGSADGVLVTAGDAHRSGGAAAGDNHSAAPLAHDTAGMRGDSPLFSCPTGLGAAMACHVWRGGPMPAAGHGQLGQAAHGWRWAQATAHQVLSHSGSKKSLTARSEGRRSGRRTTRVLELYPRSYWSPSNNYTGTGDPGRSAVRAHGCPAHPPAIRAACACLSLVLPGAQAHAAMQRRGGVEGGGPRTEQRRNHTSRQDRPPHRIALARRGLSAPPSPCRAALLLR